MKFKSKLKYESNFSIGFSRKTVPVIQGHISTALLSIPKQLHVLLYCLYMHILMSDLKAQVNL
jgi:hypothetical protein